MGAKVKMDESGNILIKRLRKLNTAALSEKTRQNQLTLSNIFKYKLVSTSTLKQRKLQQHQQRKNTSASKIFPTSTVQIRIGFLWDSIKVLVLYRTHPPKSAPTTL
jgi:hypothetical protein